MQSQPEISTTSSNSSSLLSQLQSAQLKSVEKGLFPPIEQSQEQSIIQTLSEAMIQRRQNIREEAEEDSSGEGWSSDEEN